MAVDLVAHESSDRVSGCSRGNRAARGGTTPEELKLRSLKHHPPAMSVFMFCLQIYQLALQCVSVYGSFSVWDNFRVRRLQDRVQDDVGASC